MYMSQPCTRLYLLLRDSTEQKLYSISKALHKTNKVAVFRTMCDLYYYCNGQKCIEFIYIDGAR